MIAYFQFVLSVPRECERLCIALLEVSGFASVPTTFRLYFGTVLRCSIFSFSLFYPIQISI